MVVGDYIITAFLGAIGGPDFYFSIFSLLFVFTVIYFFYNISK